MVERPHHYSNQKKEYHSGSRTNSSGKRKMIMELKINRFGQEEQMLAPVQLLPLERMILTILVFSRDGEITGRGLGRKIGYKAKTPCKIYKTLARLRVWGYVGHTVEGCTEESIGEGPIRYLSFATDRGIEKLKQDYES